MFTGNTYVVDKLRPLIKREEFGGLLDEREDILLQRILTFSKQFGETFYIHVQTTARATILTFNLQSAFPIKARLNN